MSAYGVITPQWLKPGLTRKSFKSKVWLSLCNSTLYMFGSKGFGFPFSNIRCQNIPGKPSIANRNMSTNLQVNQIKRAIKLHQPVYLSTFGGGDVFLEGYTMGNSTDGHQVNAYKNNTGLQGVDLDSGVDPIPLGAIYMLTHWPLGNLNNILGT